MFACYRSRSLGLQLKMMYASSCWLAVILRIIIELLSSALPPLQAPTSRYTLFGSFQFSSVAQSCLTLCDPMSHSMSGLPVHCQLPDSLRLTSIESVMPFSHLILCHPLLLLPLIPPWIRVFSNESTLCMRWPKYWNFSFSIVPSKEIPGLISFRMDWLDLLALRIS